jgi:hypothetical protein
MGDLLEQKSPFEAEHQSPLTMNATVEEKAGSLKFSLRIGVLEVRFNDAELTPLVSVRERNL